MSIETSNSATAAMKCCDAKLPSPGLIAAYRTTTYSAPGLEVRIGRRVTGLDRTVVFLTAWNPGSRKMQEGWNRRMQASLRELIPTALEGEGRFRRWHEKMLLATIEKNRARVLARRFRQVAIVVAAPGQRARLVFV
jgi:hypothetical protein